MVILFKALVQYAGFYAPAVVVIITDNNVPGCVNPSGVGSFMFPLMID